MGAAGERHKQGTRRALEGGENGHPVGAPVRKLLSTQPRDILQGHTTATAAQPCFGSERYTVASLPTQLTRTAPFSMMNMAEAGSSTRHSSCPALRLTSDMKRRRVVTTAASSWSPPSGSCKYVCGGKGAD